MRLKEEYNYQGKGVVRDITFDLGILTLTYASKDDALSTINLYTGLNLSSYLPLAGGVVTGAIKRFYGTASNDPMIALTSNNLDTWLWRINHGYGTLTSTSGVNGFGLKYLGTGAGNDNKLVLYSDNQTGTQVAAMSVQQDGTITLANTPKVGSDKIWHAGNDGTGSELDADLLDGLHADSFLLRLRRTNNQITAQPNQGMFPPAILELLNAGYPVYTDPEFASGNNSCLIYNNRTNGAVTITRTDDNQGSGNSSGKILKIVTDGEASPGAGGFVQTIQSRANAIFIQIFRARIPVGYTVYNLENSQGSNSKVIWLTERLGTGKWEWYARLVYCGDTGSFGNGGHVVVNINGAVPEATNTSVTWYVSHITLIDITKGNYNGLRTRYSDQWSNLRTLTIGNAGKSVDGSINVSWSLAEIGALPLTGGELTGPLTWASTTALPEKTSPQYWLVADTFTDNGATKYTTKYATLNSVKSALGLNDTKYWANVAVSGTSSTSTTPLFGKIGVNASLGVDGDIATSAAGIEIGNFLIHQGSIGSGNNATSVLWLDSAAVDVDGVVYGEGFISGFATENAVTYSGLIDFRGPNFEIANYNDGTKGSIYLDTGEVTINGGTVNSSNASLLVSPTGIEAHFIDPETGFDLTPTNFTSYVPFYATGFHYTGSLTDAQNNNDNYVITGGGGIKPLYTTISSASTNAQIPTALAVYTAINNGFATNDALVYAGTVNGSATSPGTLFPTTTLAAGSKGKVWKVTQSGYINGVAVEVGDMIICNSDNAISTPTSSNYETVNAKFDYIQANLDPTQYVTLLGNQHILGEKTIDVLNIGQVNVTGLAQFTNVINGSINGNSHTTDLLKNPRTIITNLASTSSASFNGTSDVTPGVTGVLPIANGGTGVSSIAALKTALGLGSNAYTSTAYLPLTGGTISSAGEHIFNINNTTADAQNNYILFKVNGTNKAFVGLADNKALIGIANRSRLLIDGENNTLTFANSASDSSPKTIAHSGNSTQSDISLSWGANANKLKIAGTQFGITLPNNPNVTSHLYAGVQDGTANATTALSDPYLLLAEGSTLDSQVQVKAGTGILVSAVDGVITITNSQPDLNHNTDRYVNAATFGSITDDNGILMTLTRAGSDTNTVTARISAIASTTGRGLAPKLALNSTNTITTQSSEYVLTYKSGTETTPVWRKLPTNAFKGTASWTSNSADANYPIGFCTTASPTSGNQYDDYYNTIFTFNPSAKALKIDGCTLQYDATNKCLKFIFT